MPLQTCFYVMERKRVQMVDLGHATYVASRALAVFIRQVRDEGLPLHIRASQHRKEKQRVLEADGLPGLVIREVAVVLAPDASSATRHLAHPNGSSTEWLR